MGGAQDNRTDVWVHIYFIKHIGKVLYHLPCELVASGGVVKEDLEDEVRVLVQSSETGEGAGGEGPEGGDEPGQH